jgi:thiamine biosynthesis lipoprotein
MPGPLRDGVASIHATDATVSRSEAVMGTIVTVQVPGHAAAETDSSACEAAIERALHWFRVVEQACSRFAPDSELRSLASRPGEPVVVSPLLFEAVQFSLAVAAETGGAFDPTVGHRLERGGFNREYRTGRPAPASSAVADDVSWRDVRMDASCRTITLDRPLLLDLGAVAKGLAVDLAARELSALKGFGIDAGGDLYLGGLNAAGVRWSVGIRHPLREDVFLDRLSVSDCAVCTSGNYEKQREHQTAARHLFNARTGDAPDDLLSVTVIAPTTMLADAMATAAFVLGAGEGLKLLELHGLAGLLFTATGARLATKNWNADGETH